MTDTLNSSTENLLNQVSEKKIKRELNEDKINPILMAIAFFLHKNSDSSIKATWIRPTSQKIAIDIVQAKEEILKEKIPVFFLHYTKTNHTTKIRESDYVICNLNVDLTEEERSSQFDSYVTHCIGKLENCL